MLIAYNQERQYVGLMTKDLAEVNYLKGVKIA